ncbi:hypothetical protein MGH68_15260 [Erysipelothrix sp. D19-032]
MFFGMIGATVCGLLIRLGYDMGWISMASEVAATLPQLPAGSPIVVPFGPMQSMIDNTLFVGFKNLGELLNPQAIVVVLTFLFLDFFGTATTLSAANITDSRFTSLKHLKTTIVFMLPMQLGRLSVVYWEHQIYQPILNRFRELLMVPVQA